MLAKTKLAQAFAAPYPFRSAVHTSDEERRLLFTDFVRRFEANQGFNRPMTATSIAIRVGRTPAMVYHWLSQAERNRSIPWQMLDILMLEELMVEQNIDFGHDVLAMYSNADRIIKSHPVTARALNNMKAPYPFRSSIHTSDEERRLLFTGYVQRFEARQGFKRPMTVTSIAIRVGRTPAMVYHWLSQAERNRSIPWQMLDILMLEELMVEQNIDFGHDVLAMYSNAARIIKSHSVAHVEA